MNKDKLDGRDLRLSMGEIPDQINRQRRRFFGTSAMIFAASQFGMVGFANAQPSEGRSTDATPNKTWTNTSFGPLKQIDAGLLNVGYAEAGPASAPTVLLLHGWPYDIYSFVDVAPILASAGYRVIVPYLRGYGTTRFHSDDISKRAAVGGRRRHYQPYGCPQDRQSDHRGLRLGRPDR
jgi:hypothetical protein